MMRHLVCPVAIAAAVGGLVLSGQTPSARFTHERAIHARVSGAQRLPVDAPLLEAGRPFRVVQRGDTFVAEGGLADLRLFDATGRQVPYLLVHARRPEPQWIAGSLLPVAPTRRASGFEVDLRSAQSIDMLRVEGVPAPFLKRLSVEGSGDRARWTSLAPEATLFDLPAERLRQLDVAFTPGEYRYLRVTWNDANSGRVSGPRTVRARRASRVPAPPPPTLDLRFERQASEPGRSRYRIRLPSARLPLVAVGLQVDGGGHVFRTAIVSESRFAGSEAAPAELGRATLSRVVRDGVHASDLRIPIAPPIESEIQLVIDDGSNAPLEVTRVVGTLAVLPAVYFEAPAGELVARYGDPALDAPAYDLEAVRESVDIDRVPEARWSEARVAAGAEATPSQSGEIQPGGTLDPPGFRHTQPIEGGDAGLATLQLDADALALSRGPGRRFADLRILDASNRQVPYLIERRDEPLLVELAAAAVESPAAGSKAAPGRQRTHYRLSLPHPNLPAASLVLETSSRVFERQVTIGVERAADRRHRDAWFEEMATARWRHADREAPARPLVLRVEPIDRTDLLLVVDEGDNAPLPITAARLLLPSYLLRFFHPGGDGLRLAYGRDDLETPRYDLALLARQVMGAPAREVSATRAGSASEGGPARVISPLTFWILLGAAVLVIVGVIVKLIAQQT